MADELFNRTPKTDPKNPKLRRGPGLLTVLGITALAFIVGSLMMMWAVSRGYLEIERADEPAPVLAEPEPSGSQTVAPSPTPADDEDAPQTSEAAVAEAVAAPIEQRLGGLETRLNDLDLRAQAARGNAARAEGLLVAFAARRAVERGADLGYLRDQLRLRFEDAQPNAVAAVFAMAEDPVTLDELTRRLDALSPRLGDASGRTRGWTRFRNELSNLFTIRRAETASPRPSLRIERARQFLAVGRIESAIEEVANLPNADAAGDWLRDARRYLRAQKAFERLEMTAILEPRQLQDSSGQQVDQRSAATQPDSE